MSTPTPTPTPPPAPPPASKAPPKPTPALPRAGTFRTARPTSFTAARRNATFVSRPKSYSGAAGHMLEDAENVENVPRLRRAGSFSQRMSEENAGGSLGGGRMRRRSSFIGRRSGVGEEFGDGSEVEGFRNGVASRRASGKLPRAGTFSYGSGVSRVGETDGSEIRRLSSGESGSDGVCGMCAGCGVGIKGMPPWAPERLKRMSEGEKLFVWMELQQKEARGRLERELRKKRVEDMEEIERRMEWRRGRGDDLVDEGVEEEEVGGGDLGEGGELETVDLGTERSRRSSEVGGSRGRRSESDEGGEDDDISGQVEGRKGRKKGRVIDEECGQCEELEGKVKDLEEQLGVLREVVTMCANGDVEEEERKPKTWKDKVMSAYYGGSVVTEKQRLKHEVEALRTATDFLFQKLQKGDVK